MTRRLSDPQPGIAAKYAFECPRCGEFRERGSRAVFHRGQYICPSCCPGFDDE